MPIEKVMLWSVPKLAEKENPFAFPDPLIPPAGATFTKVMSAEFIVKAMANPLTKDPLGSMLILTTVVPPPAGMVDGVNVTMGAATAASASIPTQSTAVRADLTARPILNPLKC